jgi:hypothetical protein
MIDLNHAGPQWQSAIEAELEVLFEQLFACWCSGLAAHYEPDECPDVRDFRDAFLTFCAEEFDRQTRRPHGPAVAWPRHR